MIPDINLLPPLEKKKSNPKLLIGLIGIIVLLLLVLFVWQYFNARSSLILLAHEEQALQAQRDQLQSEYGNALASENKGTLEESVAFVERVSYAVSPLLDETQNILVEHSYLRSYLFNDTSITITVDFETLSNISGYIQRLENSPYFTDIQVESVSNFEVKPVDEAQSSTTNFNEVPRYSVNMTIYIDETYLATRGVQ